jgi:hypothetical protein
MCRRCRAVWQALVSTMNGLRTLGTIEPAAKPALTESVVARIRAEQTDASS